MLGNGRNRLVRTKSDWKNLKSVIMTEAIREVIGKEKTVERRYFISSLEANAELALKCVRGHWAIENNLHWCLDIGFREDNCQVREAKSAENLATLRHWDKPVEAGKEESKANAKKQAGMKITCLKFYNFRCVRPSLVQ
jgi:predicted transposase YbfD/YdcC